MAREVRITVKPPGGDRVYHITSDDVRVVLSRLPEQTYRRVKAIHFNDRGWRRYALGYVNRGRREVSMCSLPPRISLTRYLVKGQTPEMFGARRGTQWPKLAIRRFLLYDVLLHEIGHLQIIDERAKGVNRKFAREGKAQQFGMYWCKRLWADPFDHPDPVHNPPAKDEHITAVP